MTDNLAEFIKLHQVDRIVFAVLDWVVFSDPASIPWLDRDMFDCVTI